VYCSGLEFSSSILRASDTPEEIKIALDHKDTVALEGFVRPIASSIVAHEVSVWGLWAFSKNKPGANSLLTYLSQPVAVEKLVAASGAYDLPSFANLTGFKTWADEGPAKGTRGVHSRRPPVVGAPCDSARRKCAIAPRRLRMPPWLNPPRRWASRDATISAASTNAVGPRRCAPR